MPRTAAFETHHRRYEDWFTLHEPAYHSELLAVRALLPWRGRGLEIGVGSGRFAGPLGIRFGLDPLWVQTVSAPPAKMREMEPLRTGTGTGAFVVVRSVRV